MEGSLLLYLLCSIFVASSAAKGTTPAALVAGLEAAVASAARLNC